MQSTCIQTNKLVWKDKITIVLTESGLFSWYLCWFLQSIWSAVIDFLMKFATPMRPENKLFAPFTNLHHLGTWSLSKNANILSDTDEIYSEIEYWTLFSFVALISSRFAIPCSSQLKQIAEITLSRKCLFYFNWERALSYADCEIWIETIRKNEMLWRCHALNNPTTYSFTSVSKATMENRAIQLLTRRTHVANVLT